MEIKEEYFILNSKQKIYWKNINTTGILTVNFRYGQEKRAIIGTSDKITTINRENSNLHPENIIQIISLNKTSHISYFNKFGQLA